MELTLQNTEKQQQIDNLKAQFDEKNSTLNAEYRILQAVKSEHSKTQAIIEALNSEIDEKLSTANQQLSDTENLALDDYLKLKQDEVTIKGKIDYFIAANEERVINIEKIEKSLFNQRKELVSIRNKILAILGREKLNELLNASKEELNFIRSALYFDFSIDTDMTLSGVRLNVYESVDRVILQQIQAHLKGSEETPIPASIQPEKINISYQGKSPAQSHFERVTAANNPPKPTGFKRLLNSLKPSEQE